MIAVLFLILALLLLDLTVVVALVTPLLHDQGITSLVESPGDVDDKIFFLGTKKGKILQLQLEVSEDDENDGSIRFLDLDIHDSKYPIFSLAVAPSCTSTAEVMCLFCGGGDRYISVARAKKNDEFECQQRLGPHTGWIKDLQFDDSSSTEQCLYSIGCNRIESWKLAHHETIMFEKKMTRSIDNSPQDGATLSSDLLCLVIVKSQEKNFLLSGGVDGRIHIWSTTGSHPSPDSSTRIHNGRVNRLVFSPRSDLIFSVGHDGVLCASGVVNNDDNSPCLDLKCTLHFPNSPRLSSLAVLDEADQAVDLAVGTTDGAVFFVRVNHDTKQEIPTITMDIIGQEQIANEAMINAIVGLRSSKLIDEESELLSSCSILVGHGSGLDLVTCEFGKT